VKADLPADDAEPMQSLMAVGSQERVEFLGG
jgi:hypothetical protein